MDTDGVQIPTLGLERERIRTIAHTNPTIRRWLAESFDEFPRLLIAHDRDMDTYKQECRKEAKRVLRSGWIW